ncbi:MAG: PAS domain S-box protein, partial [Planctomycetaceae bacterium]|nr:PAS domain S-box protein [Planctomycetaceae bacterium]
VEQVVGSDTADWIAPAYRARVRDTIVQVLLTGQSASMELEGTGRDGGKAWYSTRISPVFMKGEVESVILIASDMTDRQRAESTVRDSEERFRQLANSIDEGFWLIGLAPERLLYVNPAFLRIWGLPAEQLYGVVRGGEKWIHPADRRRIHDRFNDWLAGRVDSYDVEYRIDRPDGATRWVHDHGAKILDDEGRVFRASGIVRDITAHKSAEQALRESEGRYRLLADHSSDLIGRHTPAGRWLYVSPASQKILGYRPDELVGLDPFEFIHPDDRGDCMLNLQRLIETGEAPASTYRARHADGHFVWLETSAKAVRDAASGQVREVVATSRDVTERIEAMRKLRQREADLSHAERLSTMGQMASELAHELNQPLYAINNFAEACLVRLNQEPSGELTDLRRWVTQIGEQARRAADVIRRITRFVRKGELGRELLDLNRCIRDMSVLLEFGSRSKGIHVAYELADHLPAVIADSVLIEQVLLNLVRNAAEAMEDTPADKRRLVIRTFEDAGNAGVAVSDSGCGVPADCLERLFEPYFTTKPDGTGMGLAICRSTIEAHGGRIWASNNRTGGATFQFVLPPANPE